MNHKRDDSRLFYIALNLTIALYIIEILIINCNSHRCKQIAISMRLVCNACNLQSHPQSQQRLSVYLSETSLRLFFGGNGFAGLNSRKIQNLPRIELAQPAFLRPKRFRGIRQCVCVCVYFHSTEGRPLNHKAREVLLISTRLITMFDIKYMCL